MRRAGPGRGGRGGALWRTVYSHADASSGYVQKTVDLSAHKGRTVKPEFVGTEDTYLSTIFLVDQIAVG
ncbi:hypothetical protein [Streptomyces sp. NE5-10]|uniref:hypothetical protein n=1 Tax=Streptomyces sp. NE5-10 TaxID=2759674 RepID=UPI001906E248|nr:hypothetical protein [Streptomyces sp. NE5-10]